MTRIAWRRFILSMINYGFRYSSMHTKKSKLALLVLVCTLKEVEAEIEKEKLVSNIALMKLLVEHGTKGDMERLIDEFTEKLTTLTIHAHEKI